MASALAAGKPCVQSVTISTDCTFDCPDDAAGGWRKDLAPKTGVFTHKRVRMFRK